MCSWNDTIPLEVIIPSHLSHTGRAYKKTVGIDRCIYEIVKKLNDTGTITIASCCGHGKYLPSIILEDGTDFYTIEYRS
jgi:hypothetical protein